LPVGGTCACAWNADFPKRIGPKRSPAIKTPATKVDRKSLFMHLDCIDHIYKNLSKILINISYYTIVGRRYWRLLSIFSLVDQTAY
jgi:hypothetical protein